MNIKSLYIPDERDRRERVYLSKSILGVQLSPKLDGTVNLGLLSHLEPGVTVEVCGGGFNERTVKVRSRGKYYFVFLQDLESQGMASAP